MTEQTNPSGAQPEILIVEDSPIEAELLRRTLIRAGYRVTLAKDGVEGLRALRAHRYALVMSDIVMPLMSGYQLCHEIKNDGTLWNIPVILLTVLSEPEDIIEALNAGADSYLTKPFAEDVLLSRIHSLLSTSISRKLVDERRTEQVEYDGKHYTVTSSGQQILNMLLSVYQNTISLNRELVGIQAQLNLLNESLEGKIQTRTVALRASEHKYRQLFESSRDALMVMLPSGRFVDANQTARRMLEVADDTDITLLGPADMSPEQQPDGRASDEKAQELIATALREGSSIFEWECRRLNGETFFADVLLTRTDAGGQVLLQITLRDITERKRAEEKLRASEQQFMQLFMRVPIPLVVVNNNGVMARFNDRFTEILGYTTDDVPTMKEWWQRAYPDESYRQWVMDTWNAAVAKAAKEGVEIEPLEYKVTGKSGAVRNMLIGGITLEDNLLATLIDITERKQAEEKFQRFFNLIPDLVCMALADGRLLEINPMWQKTLGYTRQEILAKPFLDFVHPDDIAATLKEIERQLAGEPTTQFVNRYRCKDGSFKWLEWETTPAVDGKLLFATARDITERRQAEIQLNEQLNELRRWHEATLGMGMRSIELKREVNELLAQAGQPARYPSAESDDRRHPDV
ncbi:MAG: PAS domain S-box protein [Gallionella sp.]|nr:PAS domain S-box protein [Gallionella sp.]